MPPTGPATGAALPAGLLRREGSIIEDYRRRLLALGSPLTGDAQTWAEACDQARRVVADCAAALAAGAADPVETHLPAVIDMATRRGVRGIHPQNSVRAGTVLFDVVLEHVGALVDGRPDAGHLVAVAAAALNHSIGARLEAGAVGYDTFLLNQVREVIDADRRELAREIHDRLGNSVSLAMRQLELASTESAHGAPGAGQELVTAATEVLRESLEELRDLITGLRRSRADGALHAALAAYVASLRADRPQVSIAVNGVESWAPPQALDEVFMILREALRNVYAHARADRVTVKVDVAPHELWAAVEDDGIGFDPTASGSGTSGSGGNGLAAMRERAQSLSGHLSIGSSTAGGTLVTLWAPLGGPR